MAPPVLVEVLSWLSTICFCFLLLPQILLNYRRRSTEGLSLLLILLWHISAVLIWPYLLYTRQPLPLQLQWAIFNVASILTELQFTLYDPKRQHHWLVVPCLSVLYFSSNGLLVTGLFYLFKLLASGGLPWLVNVLGSLLGSIFLALGFFPQIYEMCRTKSSEGFSLGVTFFDVTGSSLSVLVLVLRSGAQVDPGAVVPYAVILALQMVILFCALVLYPSTPWRCCRLRGAIPPPTPSLSPARSSLARAVEEGKACSSSANGTKEGVAASDLVVDVQAPDPTSATGDGL